MIDILMATYNGEKFLSEQIISIQNQTYTDWILYIHDDGSIDRTVDIIKSFVSDKIVFVDDGVVCGSSTKNFLHLARKNSKSDYFCFSDQDDIWHKDKLEITIQKMHQIEENSEKNVPILIGTDLCVIDQDKILIHRSFYEYSRINSNSDFNTLLVSNSFTGCTLMMNATVRRYLNDINSIDINKIIQHDWFIAEFCAADGFISQIPIQTVDYRQHLYNAVGARQHSLSKHFLKLDFSVSFFNVLRLSKKIRLQYEILYRTIHDLKSKRKLSNILSNNSLVRKYFLWKYNCFRNCTLYNKIIGYGFY